MPSPLVQRMLVLAAVLSLLFAIPPSSAQTQTSASQSRITQAVDANKLTSLKGNTHPLARPEFDRGEAPASLRMDRMLLVLSRSPQQESALENLLEQQQSKTSPDYHKWLTPDEFGTEFGPSEQDIQTVVLWLESNGFQVGSVSRGRGTIEFSGSAEQVAAAFHTSIHNYVVNGEQHWANAADPQIPSALAPVVVGVDSLNNFLKPAFHHVAGVFSRSKEDGRLTNANAPASTSNPTPLDTFGCDTNPNTGQTIFCNGVTPFDFATIYNVLPLWNAATPIDGTGQSIAIVARSNINLQDVANFRSLFGLPANAPQIIVDGPDPGRTRGDDETEADLDVEWSGGVAKGATIKLVVSESTESTDGIDLSAEYIVDNDLAPIMSESFGDCELFMGTAGNEFYKNLWEQAAAEGISVFVSSGDQDSAGCDFFQGTTPQPATHGLEVSGIASTPYNVAVGGTDFNDFFTELTYWNTTNNPTTQQSAKSYIPETTWNDTCTNAIFGNPQIGFSTNPETNCNNSQLAGFVNTFGGSGGMSHCTTPSGTNPAGCAGGYSKPAWQTGAGVPSDNKRDLPDVSLFAADGLLDNFYLMCESDAGGGCTFTGNVLGIGGTSAASPAFAGLMALVNQKMGAPQGDPNFILYKLAATQSASSCNSTSATGPAGTCVFNDVTMGTIAPPCSTGTIDCKTATAGHQFGILSGFNAATAYDEATGLGTVNANNLVMGWGNVKFTSSMTGLTLNGGNAVNVTHGSPINVNVSVTPTSPKVPTGDVSLIATQGNNTFGFDTMTLNGGTASSTTNMLPGGTSYTVQAHYEGDGTYGGSYSTPVTVTVTPEASKTFANLVTFNINGNLTGFGATSATYGSGFALFRVDVGNSMAAFSTATGVSSTCLSHLTNCPTGTVSLTNNGAPFVGGGLTLNIQGYSEDQSLAPGSYAISASYPGDSSYGPSATDVNFTILKAPTTLSAAPVTSSIQYGNLTQISATVLTSSDGGTPTGTVSFSLDGNALPISGATVYEGFPYEPNNSPPSFATLSASGDAAFLTLGSHTLGAQYSGDSNYAASTSSPTAIIVTQALPFFTTYGATSPTNVNEQVTLNAQLFGSDEGAPPTGTITFFVNGTALSGNVTYTPLARGLQASLPYTPTSPGTDNITVSYSGDANYLSATSSTPAVLMVEGPDFGLSALGTTSQTISAGQTATFTNVISVSGQDNFSAQVTLSCSIPAAKTTCSVTPNALQPGSGTASVTITTTANGVAPSNVQCFHWPNPWLFVLGVLVLWWLHGLRKTDRVPSMRPAALLFAILLLGTSMVACGGSQKSSPPPPPPPTGTQPGFYIVTVTGVSGPLSHTAMLSLNVQ